MKSAILYSLCLISFISLNAQSGISYEVSAERLNYKKQQELYVFVIKNTGETGFHISNVEADVHVGSLYYIVEVIEPQEERKIQVTVARQLVRKKKLKPFRLNLTVSLAEGDIDNPTGPPSEIFNLIIE